MSCASRRNVVLRAVTYAGWAGSLPAQVVQERLEQALREGELPPEHLVRSLIPTLFTTSAPEELRAEVGAMVSEFHPAGLRVQMRAFAEADLRDVLPRIDAPTLLLYGDEDVRSPLGVAEDLHDTSLGRSSCSFRVSGI